MSSGSPTKNSSTAPSSNKVPTFSIGSKAGREVRNALSKSKNPTETIANYQMTRSLHSMFAKAFGTTPMYNADDVVNAAGSYVPTQQSQSQPEIESLDTDSVLKFLNHLGVSQYEVHKRISDALQKQLEDELRKTTTTTEGPLLLLLQNCWPYATINAEFRPILWATLKQLGSRTPLAVLQALAERDKTNPKELKYIEIFRPLPPLLKRLVWEADWMDKVPIVEENDINMTPKSYMKLVQTTILYETIKPLIDSYTSTPYLVDQANRYFVHSTIERRIVTNQRRALTNTTSMTASPTRGTVTPPRIKDSTTAPTSASALLSKTGSGTTTITDTASDTLLQAGKAVSQIRNMLSDTSRGATSYRPQLLHAILSTLMAKHGLHATMESQTNPSKGLLSGPSHLHCTLVSDILLSTSGPLPKEYVHLHSLARILDDIVKNGILMDQDIIKIQQTLKLLFDAEPTIKDGDKKTKRKRNHSDDEEETMDSDDSEYNLKPKSKKTTKKNIPNKSLMRQLNQIIISGISAMKESDPQNLFLNPVTDAIAPGYSKIIKKPMSIGTMENKIENNAYFSIDDWESDVRLMFKNCVDYNRGSSGQWFRGEAKRQLKIYVDEILPQAKKLYRIELQKRNPEEDALAVKRKREEEEKKRQKIIPLEPATKQRRVDLQESSLSMPALAAMLLADPFVVRILLDRVLRSIRLDTNRGTAIPAEHQVVPSILQLLFLAQWSPQICAIRGRQFIISDTGLHLPKTKDTVEEVIPYMSLRQYLPVIIHLLRDADIEKRLAPGGDLHSVAQAVVPRPEPILVVEDEDIPPSQIALAILEGSFIYVCLPGNSHDISLSITFVKFSKVFVSMSHGYVCDERAFFKCLVPAILRHKHRLHKTVRDVIISTWTDWLKISPPEDTDGTKRKKKRKKHGSMESAAHEYLMDLLNEWASNFGNVLIPRDLLLRLSIEIIEVVNETETSPDRKFAIIWQNNDSTDFVPIKKQYERMLGLLPETHRTQWKEVVGIDVEGAAVKAEEELKSMVDN